jgi:site-specific DNA-methyltransferase (adenine-specific)
MKSYFERNGIIIYHGDCEELKTECDLIVTDPPYGQDFVSNRRTATESFGKIVGDQDGLAIVEKLLIILKTLRRGRHVYIFGSHKLDLSKLPLCAQVEIIWDKEIRGSGDLTSPWGPQHENILFAVYEISAVNRSKGYGNLSARLRKGSVIRAQRAQSERAKFHPSEKPISILRQMIESSLILGEIVYDPFCGSGSTLIAALLEGRKAIGCEIDEKYCEVAAKRLSKVCDWIDLMETDKC